MSDRKILEVVIHASAPEIATGNVEFAFPARDAVFSLDVTAKAGTLPTLDVTVEEYDPGSDTWTELTAFGFGAQIVDVVFRRVVASIGAVPEDGHYGSRLRAVYTIGGSAGQSFTFSLSVQGKAF